MAGSSTTPMPSSHAGMGTGGLRVAGWNTGVASWTEKTAMRHFDGVAKDDASSNRRVPVPPPLPLLLLPPPLPTAIMTTPTTATAAPTPTTAAPTPTAVACSYDDSDDDDDGGGGSSGGGEDGDRDDGDSHLKRQRRRPQR